jgi:hypothetical protein
VTGRSIRQGKAESKLQDPAPEIPKTTPATDQSITEMGIGLPVLAMADHHQEKEIETTAQPVTDLLTGLEMRAIEIQM